jgi:hypothetical protein
MKYLLKIALIGFSLAVSFANADDQCVGGATRCGADGYVETCFLGKMWMSGGKACGANIRQETLCTDGDEKCGPSGKVLKCNEGKWRWTPFSCRN